MRPVETVVLTAPRQRRVPTLSQAAEKFLRPGQVRLDPQEQTLHAGQPMDWVLDALADPDAFGAPRWERDTECGLMVLDAAASVRFWREEDEADAVAGAGFDQRMEDREDTMEHSVDLAAAAGVVR